MGGLSVRRDAATLSHRTGPEGYDDVTDEQLECHFNKQRLGAQVRGIAQDIQVATHGRAQQHEACGESQVAYAICAPSLSIWMICIRH